MSNIQFVKIKELCSYNNVKKEVQSLLNDDDQVSFLPMADLEEFGYYSLPKQDRALFEVYKSYTYFKENDLLIAKITPCFENGKMGIAKNLTNMVGFGSSEYHVLTPNKKISGGRRIDVGVDGHPEFRPYDLYNEVIKPMKKVSIGSELGHNDHHTDTMKNIVG